jgi:hypothetical protein
MPTWPVVNGDVVTSTIWNGLPAFSVNTAATADYTAVIADSYQVLQQMNKATAIAFKIPTNASVAIPVGSVITVLNIGVGTCTISAVTPGTTTVLSAGTTAASPTLGQYKSAACIKTGTDAWYIVGGIA